MLLVILMSRYHRRYRWDGLDMMRGRIILTFRTGPLY